MGVDTYTPQDGGLLTVGSHALLKIISTAVLLIAIKVGYNVFYNLYLHPLRHYPGPKANSISQLPTVRSMLAGTLMNDALTLHKKYGKVVRVAPNELSFCESAVWTDAWAYRVGHDEFSKSPLQMIAPPNGVYGILGADRMTHRRYRKLLSGSFSERAMREQQDVIMRHVDLLVEKLKGKANQNEPVDLVTWFNWATFDVIGALSFGRSFDCLAEEKLHPWIEAVFGNLRAGMVFSCLRRLGLDWLVMLLVPKKMAELRMRNFLYSQTKIQERVAKGVEAGDFWDNVLRQKDETGGMTLDEMTSNAANLVLGGSETTATLLSGTIYLLLKHRDVLDKVVRELDESFADESEIDMLSVAKLTYTLAVLDEAMRVYPPVPAQAMRVVPKGGDTVNGQYLPEGVCIHLPQYAANHLPSNFSRPDDFVPERYLGAKEFSDDNFAVAQPFSVGPRNCIGKNLAYAEMRLLLAKMLWNFELELDEKSTGTWLDQRTFVLWEKKPLLVKVRERVR